MVEWNASLKGNQRALSNLAERLDSDLLSLEEDENNLYVLDSEKFDTVSDSDEAYSVARELATLLSGMARVYLGVEVDPEIKVAHVTKIKEDGNKTIANVLAETVHVRAFTSKPDLNAWAKLAEENREVAEAFSIIQKGLDWRNLYVIYEFIKDDIGGNISDDGWAESDQIDRFTATANSRDILGDEARHGSSVSYHDNPMSHGEATSLIENIFKKWLNSKSDENVLLDPDTAVNVEEH